MRKWIAMGACAALMASIPANAGEISGNGKVVPGGERGASICSYSGLNDDDDGLGFTQTFAAFFKLIGVKPNRWFNAGQSCKPTK